MKQAVMEMKRGKAVGPDKIPLEFWLEMGDCGLKWLTALFNKIKRGSPMHLERVIFSRSIKIKETHVS